MTTSPYSTNSPEASQFKPESSAILKWLDAARSREDYRPVLSYMAIREDERGRYIMAANGYRLHASWHIPTTPLSGIPTDNSQVTLAMFNDSRALANWDNHYPDPTSLFSVNTDIPVLWVKPGEWLKKIKRLQALSVKNKAFDSPVLHLIYDPEHGALDMLDDDYSHNRSIKVTGEALAASIDLQSEFLIEALSIFKDAPSLAARLNPDKHSLVLGDIGEMYACIMGISLGTPRDTAPTPPPDSPQRGGAE